MPNDEKEPRARRSTADVVRSAHEAVVAEVVEVGLGRLTMEGVAKRAATAKTSLYRRWSSPEDLLLDALHDAFPLEEVTPSADDLRGDLVRALGQMAEWMRTPTARAAVAILGERERRPELVEALYTRVFDARGQRFTHTVLRHYAERGRIDPARVTPVVSDIGEALVTKHTIDTGRVPDTEQIAAIVDQAILPALGLHPPDRPDQT